MTPGNISRSIAIVEDEQGLRENYKAALEKCGFAVTCYEDRPSAEAVFTASLPDLVIVDIGLGNEHDGGFELCRYLRAVSPTLPILFLSARDSELDVISGLRLGADDYLTKDISLAQLIERVTALFRRTDALLSVAKSADGDHIGRLQLCDTRLQAHWENQPVDLTVTEFRLVFCLARYPGQVKSRQQLMDAANLVLDDQSITAHIKRIRKKFQRIDSSFGAIQAVYAAGYRWVDSTS